MRNQVIIFFINRLNNAYLTAYLSEKSTQRSQGQIRGINLKKAPGVQKNMGKNPLGVRNKTKTIEPEPASLTEM